MAIDHAIYESVANGREPPTIRFYKWQNNSVSIGAYQDPREINLKACKKHGVEIVRRITGGRAVYHDTNDFTYSVIAPIKIFGFSIKNAYMQICNSIIDTLKELGISSTLENKNDIVVDGKKISGNASRAMDNGIHLQHGTIIYDINMKVMPEVLNIPKDLVKEKVTSILEHRNLGHNEVYEALKKNFTFEKDYYIEKLSKYEEVRSEDLAKTKYSSIRLPSGTLLRNKGACYVERGG